MAPRAVGETVVVHETWTTTGEHNYPVPDGVRAVDVVAIGGNGGSVTNNQGVTANGGRGARVTGRISVEPGWTLYVEVGGNGGNDTSGTGATGGPGGFNGGGTGKTGTGSPPFWNPGAGGGGASDIRLEPRSSGLSPDTRVIIAAGGGGAGKPLNGNGATGGGHGGHGFSSGVSGANGTAGANSGGAAGQGASGSGPGNGGSGASGAGQAGDAGQLGRGGDGGGPPANNPSGGGGGGGGGLYGGGGGQAGGSTTMRGGGGGGGGSSLVPTGGTIQVADPGSQPRVEISFTIPETAIVSGPPSYTTDPAPTFVFETSEEGSTFECRIDDAGFAPCDETHTTPDLEDGKHRLDVRSVNSMGNFDPTPASLSFEVDTTPPRCGGKQPTIVGTNGNDVLKGTPGPDVIIGLGGNDKISGRGGKDRICGGKGKDTLQGGGGADRLFGQGGADTLNGGPGKDRCVGGPGRDKGRRCEKGRL